MDEQRTATRTKSDAIVTGPAKQNVTMCVHYTVYFYTPSESFNNVLVFISPS